MLVSTDSVDKGRQQLEAFENLPKKKQNTVVDAALAAFGATGYRKTSVRDIAAAAGISKAMVFHYFGTKRQLYGYLVEMCGKALEDAFEKQFDHRVTDFFARLRMATRIKFRAMQAHPAILNFLIGAYFETDEEVRPMTQKAFSYGETERFRTRLMLEGVDDSKFKPGVDPAQVLELLVYYSYGLTSMGPASIARDFGGICRRFDGVLEMLRRNLYRPECL